MPARNSLQLFSNICLLLSAGFFSALFSGCESTNPSAAGGAQLVNSRPCTANFTQEGSFFAGKTYKTYQDFPVGIKAKAFDNLTATLAAEGWQIVSSSKDSGVISAATTVAFGQGKTAPLNVVVTEASSGGVRVSVVMRTSGGVVASEKALKSLFCKLMDSAGN